MEYLEWFLENNKNCYNLNNLEIITADVRTCEICANIIVSPSKRTSLLLDRPDIVNKDTESCSFKS